MNSPNQTSKKSTIMLFLLLFSTQLWAQRDDAAISGKFSITTGTESTISISWGNNLPEYDRGAAIACNGRHHRITTLDQTVDGGTSRPSAGSFSKDMGPSRSGTIEVQYQWGSGTGGCFAGWASAYFNYSTQKIKAPTNVRGVLNTTPYYAIKISWNKGTSIANNLIQYLIKRNGIAIATIAGDELSYEDFNVTPGTAYSYTVQTIVGPNAPSDWVKDVSLISNTFSITPPAHELTASADELAKVKLTWPNLNHIKGIDAIIIYRNNEILTDVSRTTKTYTDNDVVPGMVYTYKLGLSSDGSTSLDVSNWYSVQKQGKSLPNGKISGYVRGKTNAGILGVEITVTSNKQLNNNLSNTIYSHSTVTDANGYYEIPGIFYEKAADYIVVPKMPDYDKERFNPKSLTRKLTLDDYNIRNVDFTDTASLAISGKAYFKAFADANMNQIRLPLEGAEVWLNGDNTGVKTKVDGSYSVSVINGGEHTVQLKYRHHDIRHAGTTNPIAKVSVRSLTNGVDFENLQTDTLKIKVAAICNAPIGENATISLNSKKTGITGTGAALSFKRNYTVHSNDYVQGVNPGQTERGIMNLVLPATDFQVQVSAIKELNSQNTNKLEYFTKTYNILNVNLAVRDTLFNISNRDQITVIKPDTLRLSDGTFDITPGRQDTLVISDTVKIANAPSAEFIFHNLMRIQLNGDNPVFTDSVYLKTQQKYKYLLTQNDKHNVKIKIFEHYEYNNVVYGCALDSGTVYIYNGLSDLPNREELKLDSTGVINYSFRVGKPVLEAPYEKNLQFVAKVGGRQTSEILTAIVEGERPRNATFLTKTPEIPLFVLHDPPGDKSFATIEKGSTFSTSSTTQYGGGGGVGAYTDSKIGLGLSNQPFVGSAGGAVHLQAELEIGGDDQKTKSVVYTATFNESFSTSGEENLTGADADIYVGASINMTYALTDVLFYDKVKQEMNRDTSFAADYTGFGTTFVYTEKHIKSTLIPQLKTVYSLANAKYESAKLRSETDKTITPAILNQLNREQEESKAGIEAWNKALEKNDLVRRKSPPIKLPDNLNSIVDGNISFSAGAIYENSLTLDTISGNSHEVSVYIEGAVRVGMFAQVGDFNQADIGGLVSFRFNHNKTKEESKQSNVTTTYHLEDNDIGDFFSVELAKDTASGTPVFRTVSGSSSCPHEDNTQFRHLPSIQISGASEQRNVPSSQSAKYEIIIANRSESDETVEYAIKLDPLSNPHGAKVLVGGQDVTNGAAIYTIPTGKSFKLPVEVTKGPLASIYEDLKLVIFSTCDNTLAEVEEENATTMVKINAYFQNKCSEIDLFVPGNNWNVNQSYQNRLPVAFSKYDASEASPLTSIGLQYRKLNTEFDNGQWITVATFPKSVLINKYFDYDFNVSGLPDGEYEIRAIAICEGVDVNYSPIYAGKIDRKSAVAFGVPSPKNGILTTADIIGVGFNKDIIYGDASQPIGVKLIRKDNGKEIPAIIIGDGRNLEIRTVPENAIDELENVELRATIFNVKDVNGNAVTDSIKWSFVVNKSPVYWSPTNQEINVIEKQQHFFSASLTNKSALNQSFILTKIPGWLIPTIKSGKIPPLGNSNIDFTISKDLNTGIYLDTVVAEIDGKNQYLYVTVNVLRNPPNWTVNPSKYKYNMGLTVQFSLDETDELTSKDIRDKVAVFAGNECRGIAQIEYNFDYKKYVAHVTAYSNTQSGEQLTFRFWDTYPGIEYQSVERLSFTSNASVASVASPLVLHPEGVYQSIPLKEGWNWISFNVNTPDMSLKNALGSLNSTPGDLIKTINNNNAFSQYAKDMGWVGNLDSLKLPSSYMLYVSKADTLRILGNFIDSHAKLKLNKGWNWIGYPMVENMELNNYLKNFNPVDGMTIMSQTEFASYNPSTNSWAGSLKYLRSGQGYKLYSPVNGFEIPIVPYDPLTEAPVNQSVPAPVNYPNAKIIINNPNGNVSSTIDDRFVNTTDYENNMSITSIINQGGQNVYNGNRSSSTRGRISSSKTSLAAKAQPIADRYEIYVYVEDKLVNIVHQTSLPNGNLIGFLPVNGNHTDDGKKVVIKVYDKEEKKEYLAKIDRPIVHNDNQIAGNIEAPIVLILEGDADIAVSNEIVQTQINKEEEFTYTLKLNNISNELAVNVNVTDTLQKGFDYVSSPSAIIYDPINRTFKTTIPTIKAGEELKLSINLKANKVGNLKLGNGDITANNDINKINNQFPEILITSVEKRANSAKILIPSLFTPNGDGINDYFEIVGLKEFYPSNTLVIYNKNYQEVYRKENYQNDWSGNNQPMGSYRYVLKVKNTDNTEVFYRGFVSIIYQ
ncbi:MAG: gliding motility-associated C-terminal domain-containing protein [Pedobacter sp.]|uniref:T9SS type B sorting domain-containing protein n=1 Tax=Pedobacter sp. TaxID=1411316 RepID=UPI003568E51B